MAHSACVILSPLDDRHAALGYSLILVFGTAPVLRTLVPDVVTVAHQTLPLKALRQFVTPTQKLPASVRLRLPHIRDHASPRVHFTEHA